MYAVWKHYLRNGENSHDMLWQNLEDESAAQALINRLNEENQVQEGDDLHYEYKILGPETVSIRNEYETIEREELDGTVAGWELVNSAGRDLAVRSVLRWVWDYDPEAAFR